MGEATVDGRVIWESPLCAGIVIVSPDRDTSADETVDWNVISGAEVGRGTVSTGGTGADVERVSTEGGSSKRVARDVGTRSIGIERTLPPKPDGGRTGAGASSGGAGIGVGNLWNGVRGVGTGSPFLVGMEALVLEPSNTHVVATCSCG